MEFLLGHSPDPDDAFMFYALAEKKIDPLVSRRFPLLEARKALEFMGSGGVEGKVVLTSV